MSRGCRHRDSWVIAAGYMLWCPDCGSIMSLRRENDGSGSHRWRRWLKPQGQAKTMLAHKRNEDAAKMKEPRDD